MAETRLNENMKPSTTVVPDIGHCRNRGKLI